jgi:hypothetical protein
MATDDTQQIKADLEMYRHELNARMNDSNADIRCKVLRLWISQLSSELIRRGIS